MTQTLKSTLKNIWPNFCNYETSLSYLEKLFDTSKSNIKKVVDLNWF